MQRSGGALAIDFFFGVAGIGIHFFGLCPFVFAMDIDPQRVNLALNNPKVYRVEDYVDFIIGDSSNLFHL